nr:uncharacterized protein LOC110356483 [Columba livia]
MATEAEWSCPICHNAEDEVAYVTPCMHQFCLGCILRSAKRRSSCPLCMQTAKTIIYSVWSEEDFLEMDVPQSSDPSADGHEDEQGAYVAGLQPQVWAGLFRDSGEILEPLVSWVNEVLQGPFWWEVAVAQGTIIATLCRYGLDEEALVRELQPFLHDQTETFVRQLIDVAAERCSEQILRQLELLEPRAAQEQQDDHTASPGPTVSPVEPPAPTVSLAGPPAPSPRAQEEPHEEPGQAVAGPPTPGQHRWHQGRASSWGTHWSPRALGDTC